MAVQTDVLCPKCGKPKQRASDGYVFCPCTFLKTKAYSRRRGDLRDLGFKSQAAYDDYLVSPHWVAFRNSVLEVRSKCEREDCGATKNLQVHHLTYDRLGTERAEDVAVLCLRCHEREHGRKFAVKGPTRG